MRHRCISVSSSLRVRSIRRRRARCRKQNWISTSRPYEKYSLFSLTEYLVFLYRIDGDLQALWIYVNENNRIWDSERNLKATFFRGMAASNFEVDALWVTIASAPKLISKSKHLSKLNVKVYLETAKKRIKPLTFPNVTNHTTIVNTKRSVAKIRGL